MRAPRMAQGRRSRPLWVVAFGGNALLEPGDFGTSAQQLERARQAAEWLAEILDRDLDLLLVHGNGPQVGNVMIQMEEAATKLPPGTLDVAVAQTQGSMGFLLELALRNRLQGRREVSTVLGMVEVDSDDAGFENPTKPVGPFFSAYRAELLRRGHGWQMVEDAGRGWRKVVPSPRPLELVGLESVRQLLDCGNVVVAAGGGGIPVIRRDGAYVGVEAVIDKDYTAALAARELGAEHLIILTGVPHVVRGYGTPEAEPIRNLDPAEAARLTAEGHFPAGSMGPKVAAAVEFVEAGGSEAWITDVSHLSAALRGEAGTVIRRGH